MANVIKTVLTYNLDGSTTDFNIPFEYLARKFVVVTLLGVDRRPLTITTDYRFATRTVIATNKAWGPADGYTQLEIRRVTSATERLVDFTDGSILRAYDLNVAQIQTMHVAEEARDLTADTIGVNNDGDLDARGRRIVNVANAVDDRDVVPLGQLKVMNQSSWVARNEALQFRNAAEQFCNESRANKEATAQLKSDTAALQGQAAQAAVSAEQSKASASNSATASANSASASSRSEQNAGAYSIAAGNSATLAEHHANRAKQEADKLEYMNDFAGALKEVTPNRITFNRETTAWNSGVRSMTDAGTTPYNGVWRENTGEFNMTVDHLGNIGFLGAVGTGFLGYWNTEKNAYVSTVPENLDTGNRQIKGTIRVGVGHNSEIETASWGESSNGGWVNMTNYKWYNGGVQIGAVRGAGQDNNGLMRTTDGTLGRYMDYWQKVQENKHVFYNREGGTALEVHANGDMIMGWGGLLSGQIRARSPKRWNWVYLGAMAVSNDFVLNFGYDVRGLRGFFGFIGERGETVYKPFTFPPLDCYFQINRKGDWQVFQLANNGTQLIRRYGWSEGGDNYHFYAETPDNSY